MSAHINGTRNDGIAHALGDEENHESGKEDVKEDFKKGADGSGGEDSHESGTSVGTEDFSKEVPT